MKIWIVSGRVDGTDLITPRIYFDEKEANDYITGEIAELVKDDFYDELQEDGVDIADDNAVIEWGSEREYCYNWVYMYSSEWTEYQVSEHTI